MTGPYVPTVLAEGFVYPEQIVSRSCPDAAERRLLLAIFDGAVTDATAYPPTDHTFEARDWLASPAWTPFSAAWVADYLGLDLDAVRRALVGRQPIRNRNHGVRAVSRVNGRPAQRGGRRPSRWTLGNLI